jgi:hypothetical protein
MAVKTPIGRIPLPGWALGLNRDADPFLLEAEESPDALNVDFGYRGSVKKRKGYAAWSEDAGLVDSPRAMLRWKTVLGNEHLFYVADDGTVLGGTSAPLTDSTQDVGSWSLNEEYRVGIASLNDVVYFTALGTTSIPAYDGSSWSAITATAFDGTSARFPKAQHLVLHHDRIFAGNVKASGGTRYASRVHWSDALDAETWTASSYIDFDPDDGQQITAMHPFGEHLVIFKDHRLQLLTGKSEDSFARYNLDSEIGTTSPGTVVPYSTMLYFFDPSTGVHRFDGASIHPIDAQLNLYILDGQNRDYTHKNYAYIHEGRYYLNICWGSDAFPSRTFILNLETGAWGEYDYGVYASAVFGNALLGGGPRDASGIYTLQSGLNDDAAAIVAYFKTAWMSPDDSPSAKHRLMRLDSIWKSIGDHDITVNMFRDWSNSSALYTQEIDTDPGAAGWGVGEWGSMLWGAPKSEVYSKTTGWGNSRWQSVQFEARSTAVAADWRLNGFTIIYSSLGRVRGEA